MNRFTVESFVNFSARPSPFVVIAGSLRNADMKTLRVYLVQFYDVMLPKTETLVML